MRSINVFGVFALMSVYVFVACNRQREHINPTRSSITESVYAFGKVKAVSQYQVFSTVTGILKAIKIKPGDMVSRNAPLFVIESTTPDLNAENARLIFQLSEDNNRKGSEKIQELALSVRVAFERYQLDSALYARQQNLFERKVGSQIDLEQRQLNFMNSKSAYEAAYSRLQQLKLQLNNELQRARVNYKISKKAATDYSIRSNLNGRVYQVLKQETGELVTPQMPLATIGLTNRFLLELEVDENDIARIKKGQLVLITMDSYANQVFEGIIDRIDPIMNERSRTFTVEAHFIKSPRVLYPNLTVETNILIRTKQQVITIPKNYLVEGKYVWISKQQKRAVTIGLRDYQKVEILQGLTSTDIIYKPQ